MKSVVRAVVYAPARASWIERELEREDIRIENARGVGEALARILDAATRPQIFVVDVDALSGAEILEFHAIRDRGWFGTVFAFGKVPVALRKSLRIECVIAQVDNALRHAVSEVGFDAQTRRLPIFST